MTEFALKRAVGLLLVFIHFFSLLLAIGLFFAGGFSFDQLTTTCAIIAPIFAGFTTQIIAFFVSNRLVKADRSRHTTLVFIILTFFFPTTLGFLIWVSLIAQAYGKVFSDFEQFKMALVLFEGLFAVYAGRFITALFEAKGTRRPPATGAPAAD